MKWTDKLQQWSSGQPMQLHSQLESFLWNTTLYDTGNEPFRECFLEDSSLPQRQDFSAFATHIDNSTNKYVTSFWNLSQDTLLVIPMPRKNKNYATLKDFIQNASITQQTYFWKYIASILKNTNRVYVSTHGFGVPYLHVRISKTPKYYFAKHLISTS